MGQGLKSAKSKDANDSICTNVYPQPQLSHRDRSKSTIKRDTSQHRLNATPNKML